MSIPKKVKTDGEINNSVEKYFQKPNFKPEDMRPLKEWINKIPKCDGWDHKFPTIEDTPEHEEELMQFYRLEEKLDQIHRGIELQLIHPLFRDPQFMRIKLDKEGKPPSVTDPE